MTTIDHGGQAGWPAQAQNEVKQLRKAITAQIGEPMVSPTAAPMMGELLARLEGFSRPPKISELQPPQPPHGEGSVTPAQAQVLLHELSGELHRQIGQGGGDAQRMQALQGMADVIDNHLELKGEVLARSASDATPG